MTPLDQVLAARDGSETAEMAFFAVLLAAELFLALEQEPQADTASPLLVETESGTAALGFDRSDRMAGFVGQTSAFVGLPGRDLVQMLAGKDLMLALNLGCDNETLLTPDMLSWLAQLPETAVASTPADQLSTSRLFPPSLLPPTTLSAIDMRLAQYRSDGCEAWLADTRAGDALGAILVLSGLPASSEAELSRDLHEALLLTAPDVPALTISFVEPDAPILDRLRRVALRFDMAADIGPKQRPGPPRLV